MNTLPQSPPPDGCVEIRTWTLETSLALSDLRAGLSREVTGLVAVGTGGTVGMSERMILIASELATNALRHGRPPVRVALLGCGDLLVLEVTDQDVDHHPVLAEVSPASTGGRGLHFARAFADTVAWYTTGRAKHVWAAFTVTSAGESV